MNTKISAKDFYDSYSEAATSLEDAMRQDGRMAARGSGQHEYYSGHGALGSTVSY